MFSIAAIWPAVSPSCLPAALQQLGAQFLRSGFSAFLFIFTKKGLLSVLVIRPITGSCGQRGSGSGGGKGDGGQGQGGGWFFHLVGRYDTCGYETGNGPRELRSGLAWTDYKLHRPTKSSYFNYGKP